MIINIIDANFTETTNSNSIESKYYFVKEIGTSLIAWYYYINYFVKDHLHFQLFNG